MNTDPGAFVDGKNQDQVAQKVQSDLESILSLISDKPIILRYF